MLGYFPKDALENSKEKLEAQITENKNELDRLCAISDKTYYNFVRPFMEASERIHVLFNPISHLQGVMNGEKSQAAFTSCIPVLTTYFTELGQDKRVYEAFTQVKANYGGKLTYAQCKVLDDAIFDLELEGVNLPDDKKARVKEINVRLSELSDKFSQNLLDATNAYKMIITDKRELGEMPESDLDAYKTDEGWEFSLQMPSYIAFMTYVTNRDKREEVYRAYSSRAPENGALIPEILALKTEKAEILGYKSYAELNLRSMSAPSVDAVLEFLDKLATEGKSYAAKDMAKLKEYAARDGIAELAPHDTAYYTNKLKKEEYDYDEEALRPYFELNNTVKGMFNVVEKLFGVSFVEKQASLWDESAVFYELRFNGNVIGGLYLDLQARPEKRGGAWMDNWHTYHRDADDKIHLPQVFVVGNFPKATKDNPSLLRHDDVTTLFHEMGHALHHLLSRVDEQAVSGVNGIDWDTVEFPSQFFENFAYTPEVLNLIGIHYKTGEKLPKDMIDKITAARTFQEGMALARQLEFGMFDMLIHRAGRISEDDVQKTLDSVRKKVSVLIPPSYNRFQNGFLHIFSGGYAAGYYSYKWAEMLSSDAFLEFEKQGIFNESLAERYRDTVLALGASKKMDEIYREFLHRDPDPNAILRLSFGDKNLM